MNEATDLLAFVLFCSLTLQCRYIPADRASWPGYKCTPFHEFCVRLRKPDFARFCLKPIEKSKALASPVPAGIVMVLIYTSQRGSNLTDLPISCKLLSRFWFGVLYCVLGWRCDKFCSYPAFFETLTEAKHRIVFPIPALPLARSCDSHHLLAGVRSPAPFTHIWARHIGSQATNNPPRGVGETHRHTCKQMRKTIITNSTHVCVRCHTILATCNIVFICHMSTDLAKPRNAAHRAAHNPWQHHTYLAILALHN